MFTIGMDVEDNCYQSVVVWTNQWILKTNLIREMGFTETTILVKNLETLVCVSLSPMLIWVFLQSSQCFKIRVAQHWGRRGAYLSEKKSAKIECKKVSRKFTKRCLFQRFVKSIVAFFNIYCSLCFAVCRDHVPECPVTKGKSVY